MSALIEFAIFPTDHGESKSKYVARVIEMIRDSGVAYQFTPMGTIIETETVQEGLEIVKRAYDILQVDCNRIYSTIKIDYRAGRTNALENKITSVESKINTI